MTVRLRRYTHASSDFALRGDLYGGAAHYFRKRDLADPDLKWLIPWCQEDETYPERYPHDEVSRQVVATSVPCGKCIYRQPS